MILTIDTASQNASIVLSRGETCISAIHNHVQKTHAAFVQSGIQAIFSKTKYSLVDLDAVSVVAGPGSYTGLRVGMASAKGICYALNKPLILLDALKLMALSVIRMPQFSNFIGMICPMIDARRMEVFAALYNHQLEIIFAPGAMMVEKDFLETFLQKNKILCIGDGSLKFQQVCVNPQAIFQNISYDENTISYLSFQAFLKKDFASLAYSEPLYVKEFYTPGPGHKH
ncbi:MAG: tRNA (adenosine(37)-N6)-threonylcarbamoyltransferase complex dimerization subunit type 1 TsaB [Bacteroidetes bacterium]|nr:tRNA (adenosine(37)-N6)-threonylcarbamoyltransferase complex dimerization subunit type 1 TsaB [Bacteroidota bacterium]